MKRVPNIIILLLAFSFGAIQAGTTGKITGTVTDAETREPLPGAVITILGNSMGANTDIDGRYTIINVPVGTYTVQAKMMGYETQNITDIKVTKDMTTTVNFKLKPTIIQMEGTAVKGEKGAVQVRADATSSSGSHIRGGRSNEIGYFVDGLSTQDQVTGTGPVKEDLPEGLEGGLPKTKSKGSPGIKAGFNDDNKQFNYYLGFLDKFKYVDAYKKDVSGRIVITVKDIQGKPISDCKLTFRDDNGKILQERLTYSDGRALFFTTEDTKHQKQNIRVEAVYAGNKEVANFSGNGKSQIDIAISGNRQKLARIPLDVVFLLDATGSMDDEIARLKATLQSINFQISELPSKPDIRFALVTYRDKGDEYVVKTRSFTGNIQQFRKSLDSVLADGGGDTPEDIQSGLRETMLNLKWCEKGVRLVFLVADAPPHLDYKEQTYTYIDAMQDAAHKGIKIITVGASGLDIKGEYVFRQISQYTMGKFIFLTYGEKEESEGGTSTSVSHHTGSNFQTENLDAIIVRIIKQELSHQNDQIVKPDEEYFETTASKDADREKVLMEIFSEGVRQLLDYSIVRIDSLTPTAVIPVTIYDESLRQKSEAVEDRIILNMAKIKAFRLLERKDLRQVMSEHKLSMTGAFDSDQTITVGKLIGAQILILPKLYISGNKLELYLKMVKVETGEIMSITLLKIDDWLI